MHDQDTTNTESRQTDLRIGFAKDHGVGLHNLDLDAIGLAFRRGKTVTDLSRYFSCSRGLIHKVLRRIGIDPRRGIVRPIVGDGEKYCPRCTKIKPFADFAICNHRPTRRGGVTAHCRACMYGTTKVATEARRDFINIRKLASGCVRCGYREHPAALDFDHLPGSEKKYNVGEMLTCSIERIEAEISKCQILCSNCHKIITYERRRNGNHSHV